MKLPLVDCAPYHARLTVRACADRHEKANGALRASRQVGNAAVQRKVRLRALRLCLGCETGEARRRALESEGRDDEDAG